MKQEARDIEAILTQIKVVEKALEPQEGGRYLLWADDVLALGWGRVLCDTALERLQEATVLEARRT